MGDFARTSDSAANKQRVMAAEFENMKASIGEAALPVLSEFVDPASGAIGVFTGVDNATGGMASKLATFGTVGALRRRCSLAFLVGQAIKARDGIGKARDMITSLPPSARRAALALGTVGAALAAIEVITNQQSRGTVEGLGRGTDRRDLTSGEPPRGP